MSPNNGRQKTLTFTNTPVRVVSLVPSLTESMFDLGFGDYLVGITDYCVYPAAKVASLPKLGGTKNPRIEEILQLQPDLVLANQEENTRQTVEALEAANIRVWLNFPKTVRQALDVLWLLVGIYRDQSAAARLETIEISLEWVQQSGMDQNPVRYFCPIWYQPGDSIQSWWMTFNCDTFCHALIASCGGENIFSLRERLYPLEADLGLKPPIETTILDTRYPRVTAAEIIQADPQLILLPSEPFSFSEQDRDEILVQFAEVEAVKNQRVFLVDGSLISWHGTRIGRALQHLPSFFQST